MKLSSLYQLYFIFCACFLFSQDNKLTRHLKKCEKNQATTTIDNIDFIYLINLDRRPDRLKKSFSRLAPYNIRPFHFSAIDGWKLSTKAFNDVGLRITQDKIFTDKATVVVNLDPLSKQLALYSKELIGKTCYFEHCMGAGAIGCYLSHLSVLQDAFDSGYNTIWILEDDFLLAKDPRCLSGLIDELDLLTENSGGWDILFTDSLESGNLRSNMSRPDFPHPIPIPACQNLGSKFLKLGHKFGAHSLIIRRSGMKKILYFAKKYGIFLPYDWEIFIAPKMNIYQTNENISLRDYTTTYSDTLYRY